MKDMEIKKKWSTTVADLRRPCKSTDVWHAMASYTKNVLFAIGAESWTLGNQLITAASAISKGFSLDNLPHLGQQKAS